MVVVSSALSQELIVNAPARGSFVLRRDSCAYDRHTKTELLDGPKFLCLVYPKISPITSSFGPLPVDGYFRKWKL